MRMTNECLLQEKITLAEEESNDISKIESEKRRLDALYKWASRPYYQEPESIIERAKRWLRDVFMGTRVK